LSLRTGLWVKAIAFLPVLAVTNSIEERVVDLGAVSGEI
jgi:hypothetical protein